MSDAARIVDELKALARERGLTYRALGERLALSEPTVKRLFSRRRLSLERLEQLCRALGVTIAEVTRRVEQQREADVYRLTIDQERQLVGEAQLFYFFWMLVNRHSVASICRRYRVAPRRARRYLEALARIGIVELRAGDRHRLLVPRTVVWNPDGPIARLVVAQTAPRFLEGKFQRDDECFHFLVGKLSPASIAAFREELRALAGRVFAQSVGADALRDDSKRMGLLVAYGPLEFSLRDVMG